MIFSRKHGSVLPRRFSETICKGDLKNEAARGMFFDTGGSLFDEAGEPYRHAADGGIRKARGCMGFLKEQSLSLQQKTLTSADHADSKTIVRMQNEQKNNIHNPFNNFYHHIRSDIGKCLSNGR